MFFCSKYYQGYAQQFGGGYVNGQYVQQFGGNNGQFVGVNGGFMQQQQQQPLQQIGVNGGFMQQQQQIVAANTVVSLVFDF